MAVSSNRLYKQQIDSVIAESLGESLGSHSPDNRTSSLLHHLKPVQKVHVPALELKNINHIKETQSSQKNTYQSPHSKLKEESSIRFKDESKLSPKNTDGSKVKNDSKVTMSNQRYGEMQNA